MKFEVYYPTGNEFCVQCGNKITKPYIKLNQNRWAKPKLCKTCIKELLKQIETGELPDEIRRKTIIQTPNTITKNSWMTNF